MYFRKRQRYAIVIAIFLSLILLVFVSFSSAGERLLSPGMMTVGHAQFSCEECHQKAPGTMRQQLQAKVQFWLGMRADSSSLGFLVVGNNECLACHARPKDKHPVFRFLEPRYREARQEIAPQFCISCHNEHSGQRVNTTLSFCESCHEKLILKQDPLDISHKQLILEERWDTCLGCHDYHGNHELNAAKKLANRIGELAVREYFVAGQSPYPLPKKIKAKESVKNES